MNRPPERRARRVSPNAGSERRRRRLRVPSVGPPPIGVSVGGRLYQSASSSDRSAATTAQSLRSHRTVGASPAERSQPIWSRSAEGRSMPSSSGIASATGNSAARRRTARTDHRCAATSRSGGTGRPCRHRPGGGWRRLTRRHRRVLQAVLFQLPDDEPGLEDELATARTASRHWRRLRPAGRADDGRPRRAVTPVPEPRSNTRVTLTDFVASAMSACNSS